MLRSIATRWLVRYSLRLLPQLLVITLSAAATTADAQSSDPMIGSAQLSVLVHREMLSIFRDEQHTVWAAAGSAQAAVVLQRGGTAYVQVVYPLEHPHVTAPRGLRPVMCAGVLSFTARYWQNSWQSGPHSDSVSCLFNHWPKSVGTQGLGSQSSTSAYRLVVQRLVSSLTSVRIIQAGRVHEAQLQQGRYTAQIECRGLRELDLLNSHQRVVYGLPFFHNMGMPC